MLKTALGQKHGCWCCVGANKKTKNASQCKCISLSDQHKWSPSPVADMSSSKRNLLACGESRMFSLSSGSSGGADHFPPKLLSRGVRGVTGIGSEPEQWSHSQGWVMQSAALGRSLIKKGGIHVKDFDMWLNILILLC